MLLVGNAGRQEMETGITSKVVAIVGAGATKAVQEEEDKHSSFWPQTVITGRLILSMKRGTPHFQKLPFKYWCGEVRRQLYWL